MKKYSGFTLTELLVAATIIGMVCVALIGYMIGAGKATKTIKQGIDRYNLAQSILAELQTWEYRGSDSKTLVSLKTYLDANSNNYLLYLKKLADTGDDTGKLYNIDAFGGGLYLLDDVDNSYLKVKVIMDFAQEDVADADDDDITSELVISTTDEGIMRISVQVAHYDVVKPKPDDELAWVSAIGYKGVTVLIPSIDILFNDPSDDDLDLKGSTSDPTGSKIVLIGNDYRKTAELENGLSAVKNMFSFDKDSADSDGDGKLNYKDGELWEADSDSVDNDGDGDIDGACEQASDGGIGKTKVGYEIEIYSSEPFLLQSVEIKKPDNTQYTSITASSFIEKVSGDKRIYKLKSSTYFNVIKDITSPSNSTMNGLWSIKVTARTNPTAASGYSMTREYPFIVDTVAPTLEVFQENSSQFDSFYLPTRTTDTQTGGSKIDRVYVFEKEELTGGKYSWNLVSQESIDQQVYQESQDPGYTNTKPLLTGVTPGFHTYRVAVRDSAGNVGYKDILVEIRPFQGYDPGNTMGNGTTMTGRPIGASNLGADASLTYDFPLIQPLYPWNQETEILNTTSTLNSTYGTVANPAELHSLTSSIGILIANTDVLDGVDNQPGLDIEPGWPKVFYKVYKNTTSSTSIWADTDVKDATSTTVFVKENNKMAIVTFEPDYGDATVGDELLIKIGVKVKTLAPMDHPEYARYSMREYCIRYRSASVLANTDSQVSGLFIKQKSNWENLTPPFMCNSSWVAGNTTATNKNMYIGLFVGDQDGLKKVSLYYTNVLNPSSLPGSISYNTPIEISYNNGVYCANPSFMLSNLDIKTPGTFYYYIKIEDQSGNVSYYYNKTVKFPYYQESVESSMQTDKNILLPMIQNSSPATFSSLMSVNIEQPRILVLDMTNDTNVSGVYTSAMNAWYWNSSSVQYRVLTITSTITSDLLTSIDLNSNGKLDDYDVIVFLSGTNSYLNETSLQSLHQYLMSPTAYASYRAIDKEVFYPTGTIDVHPYYSSATPPRLAFIGGNMFNITGTSASGAIKFADAFAARWAGIAPGSSASYTDNNLYVVSNLRNAYTVSGSYKYSDPVFGHFIGQVKPEWESDGSFDADGTDDNRSDLSKYKYALLTSDLASMYKFNLVSERFPSGTLVATPGTGVTVNIGNLVMNSGVHSPGVVEPADYYSYSARGALVYGYDPDNLYYSAGTWVYHGRLIDGKWNYSINALDPDKINSKTIYLGFGVDKAKYFSDQYVMMKRLLRYLYY